MPAPFVFALAIAVLAAATPSILPSANAQEQPAHGGHDMGDADGAEMPSTAGYRAANDRMHADMDIAFTEDADVDFALAMIPHHQGAIDMARVQLEHGSDPTLRALAEEIVLAQEAEIAVFREWLASRGQ